MAHIKTYLEKTFNTNVRKVSTKTKKGSWDAYYFVYKDFKSNLHNVSVTHYANANRFSIEVRTNKKIGTRVFYKNPKYQSVGYGYKDIKTVSQVLPALINNISNRGENNGI